jgi:DNA polymerase V
MNSSPVTRIEKSQKNYRVLRPKQTGFSSPATHYTEPRIDLNHALITNPSATFYIRISDDGFRDFNIQKNDVLIVDRSFSPKENQLALVIHEGDFKIIRTNVSSEVEFQLWGVITYIIKSTV